jgi:hypothetical protein
MKKARDLAAAFALLLVALTVGSGTPAASADATCPPTKAFFYTQTETQALARAMHANLSTCADYYISLPPTPAGDPRDGTALTTVHNQGPTVHALAEVRPTQWAGYAAVNGWYAAGQKFNQEMSQVGYNFAAGDTWALNEVGTPSNFQFAKDVFNNVDGARQNFRDFVRGLYDGPSGNSALRGLVFAANPAQLSPDVADYAQKLAAWYTDTPFWQDMDTYVSTWGQETYADARAYGVQDSPLAERTAYLNDYFLHGLRLAEQGNDDDAALTFLRHAYVPLANVAYPSDGPNAGTGIGFGYTNIGLPAMLAFISAQTYAERSSLGTRLGFAVIPDSPPQSTTRRRTPTAPATPPASRATSPSRMRPSPSAGISRLPR